MREETNEDEIFEAGPGASLDRLVGVEPEAVTGEEVHIAHSEHSFWPLVTAIGLLILSVGILYNLVLLGLGGATVLVALIGWLWEPWTT